VVVFDRVLIPDRHHGCLLYLRSARYRIELPRRLRPGEKIFGQCSPGEATPEQRVCALVHEAASAG